MSYFQHVSRNQHVVRDIITHRGIRKNSECGDTQQHIPM